MKKSPDTPAWGTPISGAELARMFHRGESTIYNILYGNTWKHLL